MIKNHLLRIAYLIFLSTTTRIQKYSKEVNAQSDGLAMLSCDNLALNFLSTKPTWKNRRFFQSSTELSN